MQLSFISYFAAVVKTVVMHPLATKERMRIKDGGSVEEKLYDTVIFRRVRALRMDEVDIN